MKYSEMFTNITTTLYRLIHWPETLLYNVNNQYMGPKGLNNDYQLNQNAYISFFIF